MFSPYCSLVTPSTPTALPPSSALKQARRLSTSVTWWYSDVNTTPGSLRALSPIRVRLVLTDAHSLHSVDVSPFTGN